MGTQAAGVSILKFGALDYKTREELVLFILYGCLLPVVVVLGFSGNILTALVLFKKRLQLPLVNYLRTLLIIETLFLLVSAMNFTPTAFLGLFQDSEFLFVISFCHMPRVLSFLFYILNTLTLSSTWIKIAITIERYITLYHPFYSHRLTIFSKQWIVNLVIIVASLVFYTPELFKYDILECNSSDSKETRGTGWTPDKEKLDNATDPFSNSRKPPLFNVSTFMEHPATKICCSNWTYVHASKTLLFSIYQDILDPIIQIALPSLILLFCTVFLHKELMRMKLRSFNIGGKKSFLHLLEDATPEDQLSLILCLILVAFMLCNTPSLLVDLHQFFHFSFISTSFAMNFEAVANLLLAVGASFNVVIYSSAGKRMRRSVFRWLQLSSDLTTSFKRGVTSYLGNEASVKTIGPESASYQRYAKEDHGAHGLQRQETKICEPGEKQTSNQGSEEEANFTTIVTQLYVTKEGLVLESSV